VSAQTVIFLGPSMATAEAAEILPAAEFLPPIRRGDINALMARETPPTRVGIVDGCFLHAMSISPKEITKAMNKGVEFYGSSSMGALRATELHRWGMTGVGDIFQMFHTGEVDADDEVAITFDPDTLRALSVPMVNFRVAVRDLTERGLMEAEFGQRLLAVAKALYFPDRTVEAVFRELALQVGEPVAEKYRQVYVDHAPDAKRDDAVRLLRLLAEHTGSRPGGGRGGSGTAPSGATPDRAAPPGALTPGRAA